MLGRFAKFLLVLTAVAPIALTWAFADWRARGLHHHQSIAIAVAGGLAILCALVIAAARKQLPVFTFDATTIKNSDSEVVGFLVAYLLPLVSTSTSEFDYTVLAFVSVLLGAVVWSSQSYSVNPLLSLLGYHFYEVASQDGVVYLLLTRSPLRRSADITHVAELSRTVLIDMTRSPNAR